MSVDNLIPQIVETPFKLNLSNERHLNCKIHSGSVGIEQVPETHQV